MRNNIKDFYGAVIGYVDVSANGDAIAHDRYGKILGSYKKSSDVSFDFYGRALGYGDMMSSLVYEAERKRKDSISGKKD